MKYAVAMIYIQMGVWQKNILHVGNMNYLTVLRIAELALRKNMPKKDEGGRGQQSL